MSAIYVRLSEFRVRAAEIWRLKDLQKPASRETTSHFPLFVSLIFCFTDILMQLLSLLISHIGKVLGQTGQMAVQTMKLDTHPGTDSMKTPK